MILFNKKMNARLAAINHMILPCLWVSHITFEGVRKKNKFG